MDGTLKILLIEDNMVDAKLITEMLKDVAGVSVELSWADRLSAGLQSLAGGRFDALLLDLGLPDSRGIETLEKIQASAPDVPVIVLTGLADETIGVHAVQQGAQDYLVKGPTDGEMLMRSVRYAIERKKLMRELQALSLVDELTGLNNRRGFLSLSEQQVRLARRDQRELLFILADLDNMKHINDTFGHEEGDQALRDTALVLRKTFRDSDVIGRIGGDEFAVCIVEERRIRVDVVQKRLKENLKARNAAGKVPYELSLSMGTARCEAGAVCSVEEMLARADKLMYKEKSLKKKSRLD